MSGVPKTSWRELDVEQMANWDDVPRRGLLALLAFILFFAIGLYAVMPAYVRRQKEYARTQVLQQQYVAAIQSTERMVALQNTSEAQALRPLSPAALSSWMVSLADNAEVRGLESVNIKPIAPTQSEASTKTANNASIGKILISVEGSYADILKWWSNVSSMPLVLSMDHIELTGTTPNRVRGQVQVSFAQEPQP